MKVACLYSGGKDSNYAYFWAISQGFEVELMTMVSGENSMMFHHPNTKWCKLQAEAIGAKITFVETGNENELGDLKNALAKMKIQGVVSGAVASEYQKQRIEEIAEELKLASYSPLWRKGIGFLRELCEEFEIILSSVSAQGLGKEWLGRKIDSAALGEIEKLNKKFGVDPFFEGGEAETFVCNAPFFKKRIEIKKAEKKWEKTNGVYEIVEAKLA
ncbi:Diphthamide synthase [Candidatus Gugararchaeum adminiculabundum]|nr:Diphthamide synthase [Candidatus Gugararchaeum adminiculabundum]